jgi:hypothetical protein
LVKVTSVMSLLLSGSQGSGAEAVPCWSSDLAVARHLPRGRSPGGDRHLNFYGNQDNLISTVGRS